MEISTSILSVEKENATRTFYDIEVAKTDYFHIDVMDGKFVEKDTSSCMKEYATTIKLISNLPLDVHLMVENQKEYIEEYSALEPKFITIHYESFKNNEEVQEAINYIKEMGLRAGLSIKPQTKVEDILDFLPFLSLVLVMTVEPGKGGQDLIPETLEKITELAKYREEKNLDYFIEADGGINLETIADVANAGCDIAVVGSAIINAENKAEIIQKLKM